MASYGASTQQDAQLQRKASPSHHLGYSFLDLERKVKPCVSGTTMCRLSKATK
jgi:hypothetical protein